MNLLGLVQALNLLVGVASQAGINWQKYKQLKDQADAEGRDLTDAELQQLADDAQAAIDRL